MKNCGISRWDDPKEINAKLRALTDQPIWEVSDEYYNNVVLPYYDEKCKASHAVFEEAQKYIPGGVQHNLAFNKPFPMCMSRAEGAYLYDKDGNRYIDFLQAGGPTILGSNYAPVREKVIELLNECGPVTGLLHESEMLIAREINRHMPNVEMFRMLGSGTESVLASLRIARIATGKKHIIKVGGAYPLWLVRLLDEAGCCAATASAAARPPSSSSPSARRAARARSRTTTTRACARSATSTARC